MRNETPIGFNFGLYPGQLGCSWPGGKTLRKFVHALLCTLAILALAAPAGASVLYGSTSSGSPGELYILNPATGGIVTDVGALNDALSVNYPITGLAFNPVSGVLYG